ncbi:MAG: amidoligase family protein [Bacilli bacterium]|nr:amidoligase family protein [Bacilli bacterium]
MDRNDNFSALKGTELLDLLVNIENYNLEYRNSLDLDENVTFGIEIEYERLSKSLVKLFLNRNFNAWFSRPDGSLTFGGEVISPIMRDNEETWRDIKKICTYLRRKFVVTSDNAGGHIHVGAHILGNDHNKWRKFIKTYAAYEDILFRFLYGDKLSPRKTLRKYAPPIASMVFWRLEELNEAKDMYALRNALPIQSRAQAVNFTNVKFHKLGDQVIIKNTIEFRCPNSTTEEVIWQNNINALTKLMIESSSNNFDEEYIDYVIEKNDNSSIQRRYMYNEVMLKKALDYVDLIFDNNQDKIYFLRQYLKNFEEINDINFAFKAKKFIKKA